MNFRIIDCFGVLEFSVVSNEFSELIFLESSNWQRDCKVIDMKTSFGLKLDSLTHKTSVVCFEFLQFRNVKRQKYKVIDKYFD